MWSRSTGDDPEPAGAREEFAESWRERRPWPTVAALAVGVLLLGWLAGGGGGLPEDLDSNRMTIERSTEPVTTAALPAAAGVPDEDDVARVLPLSWGRMADAPITAVPDAPGAAFADGVVLAGERDDQLALAYFRLADLDEPGSGAGRWTALPESPLPPRSGPLLAVISESQLLVWGGIDGDDDEALPRSDGAVLDTDSGTWTVLPPFPLQGIGARDAVWTGAELVVVGSGPRDRPIAMRWEPDTNVWERLEDPPVRSMRTVEVVASNGHVVALGVLRGRGETRTEVFFIGLDLATMEWREYRLFPPRRPYAVAAVSTGDRLLVWGQPGVFSPDAEPDGIVLDPVTGQWRQTRPAPNVTRAGVPTVATRTDEISAIWTGQVFIVAGAADLAPLIFEPEQQQWVALVHPPPGAPEGSELVWAHGRLLRWGGHVDGARSRQLWILPAVMSP